MRGKTVIGFLVGLVIGSVLTYHGLKNKVEAEIDEEVDTNWRNSRLNILKKRNI